MAEPETREVDGALIQGEGDTLYFIPSEILQNYKVEGGDWETAREALAGDEVGGFDFGASMPTGINIKPMRAFSGPFGRVRYAASVGDEPTVPDAQALTFFRG
jgi:hypothetical protein